MLLTTDFIALGTPPRPGIKLLRVESITIHWIGALPRQKITEPIKYWVDNRLEASAHYVLKDKSVINCIPIDEVAWHCGDTKGNHSSIGIEVIPMDTNGEFSADSIFTLKELLATLPAVPVKRHYDWTNKDCPRYYTPFVDGGQYRWARLASTIQNNGEKQT